MVINGTLSKLIRNAFTFMVEFLYQKFMLLRWILPLRNALWETRGATKVTRAGTKKSRMSQNIGDNKNKVFKVVLTGGKFGVFDFCFRLHVCKHRAHGRVYIYLISRILAITQINVPWWGIRLLVYMNGF